MASIYELEAMIVSRDKIIAKVLEVFIAPKAGEEYLRVVGETDQLISGAAASLETGG